MTQKKKSFSWIRRIVGIILLIWSLPSLLSGLALFQIFGVDGLIWLMEPLIFVAIGLVLLLGGRKKRAQREEKAYSVPWNRRENAKGRDKKRGERPERFTARSRRGEERAEDYDIPSNALSTQGRLKQLETLREAGLMTREEYQAKREQILSGR